MSRGPGRWQTEILAALEEAGLELRLGFVGRENAATKARRYLLEARLTVELVDGEEIRATCRGSDSTYQLGYMPGRAWWCDCLARSSSCAHINVLKLVTLVPTGRKESHGHH